MTPPHSFSRRSKMRLSLVVVAFGSKEDVAVVVVDMRVTYRLIDLRARSFLRGDYQTTWGWAKVFLKALVE